MSESESRTSALDKALSYPIAVRHDSQNVSWSAIHAEEIPQKHNSYIMLQAPKRVKWGTVLLTLLSLPNLHIWNMFILASVLVIFYLGTHCYFFDREVLPRFIPIYVVCDVVYFFDFILILLHRYWKKLSTITKVKKSNICFLITDIVTFIPQELIVWIIFGPTHPFIYYCRLITCLRLHRVLLFSEILKTVQFDKRRWFMMQFFVFYMLSLHIAVCVMYRFGCHDPSCVKESRWTTVAHDMETNSIKDWYILCYYVSLTLMANVGFGDFYGIAQREIIFITLLMLVGFLSTSGILIGLLSVQIVNFRYRRTIFAAQMKNAKKYLSRINAPKTLKKQILNYYSILWTHKNGVKYERMFKHLPMPLRMEINYDINLSCLKNSLLFNSQSEPFLRQLSLVMKNEFYLPGDVVFYQGVIKNKLLIIVNGVLEILSDEDDHSPIISFKTGTVLGECALLMNLPAKATVRAATYSELQVIDKVEFMRMMCNHSATLKYLQLILSLRIKNAKEGIIQVNREQVINLLVSKRKEFRPIKLLKNHLSGIREVSSEENVLKKGAEYYGDNLDLSANNQIRSQNMFNEECLSLYKLSPNVTTFEPPRIFLTYKFPWILDPDSSLIYYWNITILLAQTVVFISLPYLVAFNSTYTKLRGVTCVIADAIYLFNIGVLIVTAVKLKDKYVKKVSQIINYNMGHLTFYVDILSLFPFETIVLYILPPSENNPRVILFFNYKRMLRVWRVESFFHELEENLLSNIFYIKIIKYAIYLFYMTYFSACLLYITSCPFIKCREDSWYYVQMLKGVKGHKTFAVYDYPLTKSSYYAVMVFLRIGFGDTLPVNQLDISAVIILVVLGMLTVSYFIAQLIAILASDSRSKKNYRFIIFSLDSFLRKKLVPNILRQRVLNYFCVQWYFNKNINRDDLLKTAPDHLRSSLEMTELKEVLSDSPLFKLLDIDFIMMIATGAKINILPSDEIVYYKGAMSREMYILQSGYCETILPNKTVCQKNNPGSQFGALEMIYGFPKMYTIRTVTNCILIHIDYKTYMRTMSMFPNILNATQLVMNEPDHLNWVQSIEKQKEYSTSTKTTVDKVNIMNSVRKFLSQSIISTWINCKNSKGVDDYWAPFKELKKFRFCQFLMLPLTFHPQGPFLKIWCSFRIALILIMCLIMPFFVAVAPYAKHLAWVLLLIDITAYLDIYLLCHVAYYNEIGILVTHPKNTLIHYLTHSFFLDFMAIFPVKYLIKLIMNDDENHDPIGHLVSPHYEHSSWNLLGIIFLHRFLKACSYLSENILSKRAFSASKLIVFVIIIINISASRFFSTNCRYTFSTIRQSGLYSEIQVTDKGTTYYGYLLCHPDSWFKLAQCENYTSPLEIYSCSVYIATNILLGVGSANVEAHDKRNIDLVSMIAVCGVMLFAYIIAYLANSRAKFSMLMCDYLQKLQDLKSFMENQKVDPALLEKVLHYYEYIWHRTSGVQPLALCQRLSTSLDEDVVLFLYEKTLREVPLFENVESSFIRVIAKHLSEQNFVKGDVIVRSLDVHSNIYIIYRGKVEILSEYEEMIACMGVGGLFGNIRQVSNGCSTFTVTASGNVDLLEISSETFYAVIADYPRIKYKMSILLKTATDFIMPTTIIQDDESTNSSKLTISDDQTSTRTSISIARSASMASTLPSEVNKKSETTTAILKETIQLCMPHRWFKFALKPDNKLFKIMTYIIFIATYFNLIIILYDFVTLRTYSVFTVIILLMEPIFWIKIFCNLHKAHMDKYGSYNTNFRTIAHHYVKNKTRVFWDVFPNIPVEAFCFLFSEENKLIAFVSLRLFHLLRIYYIIDIIKQKENNLFTNKIHLLLVSGFFWISISIHLFSCLWLFIACPFNQCIDNSWMLHIKAEDTFEIYISCVYYIEGLATVTGIGDIVPRTIIEIIYCIIIILICRFITAIIIGDIITVINTSAASLTKYEYAVGCLQDFVQNQKLSDHQMSKLWSYVRLLWSQEKGQHMPVMIKEAPYVLRCDIMNNMFGEHLRNSILFSGIQDALLRQIAVRFNRIVFFAGNYIVQHGDTDQNMYFIHSGEVSVLTVHSNLTETRHELLCSKDMFGLAQGLFHGVPHHFSFRAETKVQMLVLNLNSWSYLLKFFPEEKEIIYNRAKTLYIKI